MPRNNHDTRIGELEARLAEALAQKAAIGEILRVISESPTDVQPVLDAVAERSALLCTAPFARVLLVDGDVLRPMAQYSVGGQPQPKAEPVPLQRTSITGRAALDRATVHLADIVPLLDTEFPDARENALREGFRAVLAVPLMREGVAYGAIFLYRPEPGLFSPEQVALLQTFAEQVAIAVDNVRLFKADEGGAGAADRHQRDPARHHPARRPTSSRCSTPSPRARVRLCGADVTSVVHVRRRADPAGRDQRRQTRKSQRRALRVYPMPPRPRNRRRARDPDAQRRAHPRRARGPRVRVPRPRARDRLPQRPRRADGPRGQSIGAISVGRDERRPFPDTQIALLKTFADQAVIAIENVRLFTELERATATSPRRSSSRRPPARSCA